MNGFDITSAVKFILLGVGPVLNRQYNNLCYMVAM